MTNNDAVTRIDAAIRRIEAALDRRARHELALRARHEALRQEVAATVAAIDQTLAASAKDAG